MAAEASNIDLSRSSHWTVLNCNDPVLLLSLLFNDIEKSMFVCSRDIV
jgi:hypothetical protein